MRGYCLTGSCVTRLGVRSVSPHSGKVNLSTTIHVGMNGRYQLLRCSNVAHRPARDNRLVTSSSAAALARIAWLLLFLACASAQASAPLAVAPGVFALMGRSGEIAPDNLGRIANSAFIVGPRGVVVDDSCVSLRQGEAIIAAVRRVTRRPIRLVVLTHASREVVFGAAAFQARGIPVWMHAAAADLMASRCDTCLAGLAQTLGAQAMAGSRVVAPDRVVTGTVLLDVIGRPLMLIAPEHGAAPGAIAVFDVATRTLIAGALVSIERVPDMRDASGPWHGALAMLASTHCGHLIPGEGRVGSCADIDGVERYFTALDERVRELLTAGVGLAELAARCELPEFSGWGRYGALHVSNANREYLRMERESFDVRDWNPTGVKD
jgi:glyoxylase-like metal-dependent hydrolase (beta-lactamase superfamily II)